MPFIAGYLLKLSVSLSVVYLFYILVLRRLTFYNCNRWYLLGYSFLAFFIPFINISPVLEQTDWDKNMVIQLIPVFGQFDMTGQADLPHAGIAWWSFLLAGTMIGMLLMVVRFLVRYISYRRIRRSASLMVDSGVKVYHVDKSIIPFSFGNAIFINPQLHSEEDLKQIIHHEFIHVKQKHTIDILWGELLCMLNWYNPFAWLIKKAMRQNLEFIADHKVLENGIDKKHYQYLLLKVTDAAHFSLTQQFNFSSLKKRIIMMNRSRSAKIQLTRFLFLLPLLTVSLLAFRSEVIEQERIHELSVSRVDITDFVKGKMAAVIADTIPGGKQNTAEWAKEILRKNLSLKNIVIQKNTRTSPPSQLIVVYRKDGTIETYTWSDKNSQALFQDRYGFLPLLPKDSWTKDTAAVIKVDTVSFVDASLYGPGNPYLRTPQNKNPLIVIDGIVQENGMASLRDLKPDVIDKMTVLKDESAVYAYGEKAKDGVIEIETKLLPGETRIDGSISTGIDSAGYGTGRIIKFKGKLSLPVSLYIVNDIEFSRPEFEKMNIDPDRIESIEVIKGEEAIKKYGEKARNGVIKIKLKPEITYNPQPLSNEDAVRASLQNRDEIVYIIDGYTYAVSAGGSTARMYGVINTVIIDDKFYNIGETNKLFKRNEFNSVGAVDAKTVLRVHGKNEPAIVLSRNGFDHKKYGTPLFVSENQP